MADPMGNQSNAGRIFSKVHDAVLLAGKVKTVVNAAQAAYPYIKAGAMGMAAFM